jgi:hypothetical protein
LELSLLFDKRFIKERQHAQTTIQLLAILQFQILLAVAEMHELPANECPDRWKKKTLYLCISLSIFNNAIDSDDGIL